MAWLRSWHDLRFNSTTPLRYDHHPHPHHHHPLQVCMGREFLSRQWILGKRLVLQWWAFYPNLNSNSDPNANLNPTPNPDPLTGRIAGDPAAAACSTIALLQNCDFNKRHLDAENVSFMWSTNMSILFEEYIILLGEHVLRQNAYTSMFLTSTCVCL